MQKLLKPKNLLFPPDKSSYASESSQGPDKNSPSQQSKNFPGSHETIPIKWKKLQHGIPPKHSKGFYKRLNSRSAMGRIPSQRILSKQFLSEAFEKFRTHSVSKQRPLASSEMGSPKSFKFFSALKNRNCLNKKAKKSSLKGELNDNIFKGQNKDARFVLDTGKFLFNKLKQHPLVVICNKGKNKTLAKEFSAEVALALQESDLFGSRTLNYSKFCQVLTRLRFIKSPFHKTEQERLLLLKAWELLGGYQESLIHVCDLHLFALIIMNLKLKINQAMPNSPQYKKKSIWSLNAKDLPKLREEFICFYLNRTEPKESEAFLSSSQEISDSSCAEGLEDSSVLKDDKEKDDEVSKELKNKQGTRQIIRKISLKELAMSSKSGALTWQSTSETPKNYSFRETSEDIVLNEQVLSPINSDSKGICKISVKRVSTRLDDSKIILDNSGIFKTPSTRFKFPDDLLSELSELKDPVPKSLSKRE